MEISLRMIGHNFKSLSDYKLNLPSKPFLARYFSKEQYPIVLVVPMSSDYIKKMVFRKLLTEEYSKKVLEDGYLIHSYIEKCVARDTFDLCIADYRNHREGSEISASRERYFTREEAVRCLVRIAERFSDRSNFPFMPDDKVRVHKTDSSIEFRVGEGLRNYSEIYNSLLGTYHT